MKMRWGFLAIAAFCSMLGFGPAKAADPTQIKVGILLPLTGPFAAVAETQKQGALLAVDVINKRGGLNMPWGKVKVEGVVDDDEAKLDVGVRRYRYLVSEGVKGVGGQTWSPLAYAINAIVSKDPMPYFPVCVMAKEAFQKGKLADSSFATAYSPWTVGYMAGKAAVQTLGKKRVFFLARSDSWGWDMRDGAYAAAKEFGGTIVGYDEASLGTSDFTTILQKVRAAKPDVLIAAQFAADSVALLKQVSQMGLGKEMTIFNAFITNVVAKGLPPEALQGVYAMHYFYYDLSVVPGQSGGQERAGVHRAVPRQIQHAARCLCGHRLYRLHGDVPWFRGGEIVRSEKGLGRTDGQWRQVQHHQGPGELASGSFGRLQVRGFPGQGQRRRRAEERMGSVHRGRFHGRRIRFADAQVPRLLIPASIGQSSPLVDERRQSPPRRKHSVLRWGVDIKIG